MLAKISKIFINLEHFKKYFVDASDNALYADDLECFIGIVELLVASWLPWQELANFLLRFY